MHLRTRKLIGTVALLVLVSVWGLFAMALAQSVLTDINGFVAAIYYVVAGLPEKWEPVFGKDHAPRKCQAALTRRKPFHIAVAAPDIRTFT